MLRGKFLILFFVPAIAALGQEKAIKDAVGGDTKSQFETFKGKNFTAKVNLRYQGVDLEMENDAEAGSYEWPYTPNVGIIGKFDFEYLGYGLSFSKDFGAMEDTDVYGEADFYDFQLYRYERQWALDLVYQDYQGFYIDDAGLDAADMKISDSGAVRNDLWMYNIGANYTYAFMDDFSLKAAYRQSEKVRKFAWSPLGMVSLSYYEIGADSSIIPASLKGKSGEYSVYNGGDYTSLLVSGGIGAIYPFLDNYYVSAGFLIGTGLLFRYDHGENDEELDETVLNWKYNFRFSLGYSAETFIFGINTINDYTDNEYFLDLVTGEYTGFSIAADVWYTEVFFGYRF